MAPYSATLLIPAPKDSADQPLSGLSTECGGSGVHGSHKDAGGATRSGLERRWTCVAMMMVLVVMVVVVVTLVIGVIITTHEVSAAPPSPPQLYTLLGNITVTVPMTKEKRHLLVQQLQELEKLPVCQVVNESVKTLDILRMNSSDEVLGEVLEGKLYNYNIFVTRCRGLCRGPTCCLPSHVVNEDFVVKYQDKHGAIQYAKRQVLQHLQCHCHQACRR